MATRSDHGGQATGEGGFRFVTTGRYRPQPAGVPIRPDEFASLEDTLDFYSEPEAMGEVVPKFLPFGRCVSALAVVDAHAPGGFDTPRRDPQAFCAASWSPADQFITQNPWMLRLGGQVTLLTEPVRDV